LHEDEKDSHFCKKHPETNMLIKEKSIAIVGGGPGGLTLARLLQQKEAPVKLYERDADRNARLIGSPLDMHDDSGMAALREAGLIEELKKNYHPGADKKTIVDQNADILFSDHDTKQEPDFGSPHANPEIDRPALRNLLLDSLKPDTVHWDSHLFRMEPEGAGWRLHFRNDKSGYADLVIGADGTNSKIRPYLTNIRAFYTGITMLEINIPSAEKTAPAIFKLLNGGKIMAFADGKAILGGQKSRGDLGFYAAFRTGDQPIPSTEFDFKENGELLRWFRTHFPGWSEKWNELFLGAEIPVTPRPIMCMPPDQTWLPLPNLALIGDAAHVMPPFAGEGANTAMGDALALSRCLNSDKYPGLQEAIAAFESDMRSRASAAATTSLQNGEWMFSTGALERMLTISRRKG
jgi:2-polyprenyl-6-methoxyphenol hydroxylase-like FAD-dependent oxidoreductase